MKMELTTDKEVLKRMPEQRNYCYFVAETPDDIYVLGQMSKCLPYSSKGVSIDNHVTLGVRINDLVRKVIEDKSTISEE